MKPEIYAAKKAIVPIPIAMMRMIRSSLVIPANMTQDRGVFRLNISWPVVPLRGVSEGTDYCELSPLNRFRNGYVSLGQEPQSLLQILKAHISISISID